jgi:uncharacterized protein
MRTPVSSIVMPVMVAVMGLAPALISATAIARPLRVDEIANPGGKRTWVTDGAKLLGPDDRRRIDARLTALDRDLGVQLAIVTVDDVVGNPKEFATALLHRWGVGKRGRDSGMLMLVVRKRRRIEIDSGYGMEASLPDGWLGQMQVDQMVPRFRRNEYAGGIIAGIDAIDTRLRAEHDRPTPQASAPTPLGALDAPLPEPAVDAPEPSQPTMLLTLGALGAGAVLPLGLLVRRRRRTCRACHVAMRRLVGRDRDAHLDEGQLLEQRMGAVQHSVYRCPACATVKRFQWVRWFSGVTRCGRCQRRCRVSHETMLQAATTYQGGLVRTRSECNHCNDVRIDDQVTPALPVTVISVGSDGSSSSASFGDSGFGGGGGGDAGGGGFGGGDGGGGGAGSSW